MTEYHIATTVCHPLPKEFWRAKLENPLANAETPATKNESRAYARAAATILIAKLEDYWEEFVSAQDDQLPDLDMRLIPNGAIVIFNDPSTGEHRDIVCFKAYPVEHTNSDGMVHYRGYKIYRTQDGWHIFDDLRITRSDTLEQAIRKIDLTLGRRDAS